MTVGRVLVTAQVVGDAVARLREAGHVVVFRDIDAPMPRDEFLAAPPGVDALSLIHICRCPHTS